MTGLFWAPGMLHSADHGSWSNLLELHASKSAGSHSLGDQLQLRSPEAQDEHFHVL
jgi:hypothetical protein